MMYEPLRSIVLLTPSLLGLLYILDLFFHHRCGSVSCSHQVQLPVLVLHAVYNSSNVSCSLNPSRSWLPANSFYVVRFTGSFGLPAFDICALVYFSTAESILVFFPKFQARYNFVALFCILYQYYISTEKVGFTQDISKCFIRTLAFYAKFVAFLYVTLLPGLSVINMTLFHISDRRYVV